MTLADINFDELTNNVFIRLLATRELTAEGNYAIVVNVKLSDNTMYSTALAEIINVDDDNPAGYVEQTVALALTVVNFPSNVDVTGCSPRISNNNTWLVYDDSLNAYVDTGVSVGYADLTSRYDNALAEIVAPATQATDAANAAAALANTKAGLADDAATLATTKAGLANDAAVLANAKAALADEKATAANTAAGSANSAASAANDAASAASSAASAATTAVVNMETVFGVLAHADATVETKLETLAALVIGIISGTVLVEKLSVRKLEVWGDNNLIFVASNAPDVKPDRAGQIWIDKANNAVYKSTGNSAVSDWKTI
ncbi:MAG: hypothetical protein IJQ81_06610 [Oscillibacter sp.]|nr:hypothetical protein [Oscillibacter sp.]